MGIAVDLNTGDVYVADRDNDRIQKFTSEGDYIEQWRRGFPWGIAVDTQGNVYLSDDIASSPHYDLFDSIGGFKGRFGASGSSPFVAFVRPFGIAVNKSGYRYVLDEWTCTVHMFDPDGNPIKNWGKQGTGVGEFDRPNGIAVDPLFGYVFVADTWNHRIQKFDSGGHFILQWGGPGDFNGPYGIAVDSQTGVVYVADTYNNRIKKFNTWGDLITQWGSYGTGPGMFDNPMYVAVDASHNVYVTDRENNRVQKFNPNGEFLTQWGSYGDVEEQFEIAMDIGLDTSGNLYILDWTKGF
jgi:Uncharacterized conserved protein